MVESKKTRPLKHTSGHSLTSWLARPTAVLAWTAALLLAGAWAAAQVPLEWTPRVELPQVRLTASWPGASPRAVERYVTAPLERTAAATEGTAGVESLSQAGRTTVTLEVAEATDLSAYVARVSERLALVREELPEHASAPRLTKEVPDALKSEEGFMTIQLAGAFGPMRLKRMAEKEVGPRLRSLGGVADVTVRGGAQRELLVRLQPERLRAHNLPIAAARQALREATESRAYGPLALGEAGARTALLFTPARSQVQTLRQLPLPRPREGDGPPVRLEDVAEVQLGPAPRRRTSRIDGEPALTLRLDRAAGRSLLQTAEAVRERLDELRESLPDGARLLVADDESEAVRAQLWDLAWRGGLALVLVALALLMMLRSVRVTGAALLCVAVSMAVALALMRPLGLTLNLLTLAGLAIVFGLLVDNGVVAVEQIARQRARLRRKGVSGDALEREATRRALGAVWLPLLGGTLTTTVVMGPLVYLSGELRALFLPFGVLVALVLLASLVAAALLAPVLGRFFPSGRASVASGGAGRLGRRLRRIVETPYAWAARVPRSALLALVLALGTPLWLLPEQIDVPTEGENTAQQEGAWPRPVHRLAALYNDAFDSALVGEARDVLDPALGGVLRPFVQSVQWGGGVGYDPEPTVQVRLGFPPGTPVARADSLIGVFEREALQSDATRRTLARASERGASLRVRFRDDALQTAAPYVVRERLIQRATRMAGIDVSVSGLLAQGYYSGSGANVSGLTVVAYGPRYERLQALAERFAARLREKSRRVAAVDRNAGRYGRQEARQVLQVRWGADAAARSGVSAAGLAEALAPRLRGRFPSFYADVAGEAQVPVRIVTAGASELSATRLGRRPIAAAGSTQVRLADLSQGWRLETQPSQIEREDQQYKRYLRVDYRGPHRMGHELVSTTLEHFERPPGYRLELRDGVFFGDERTRRAFWLVILATLALVYLVTAAVFESWRLPWAVLLGVPTALLGVAAGFLWSGAPFAEGAFIGAVLLVGIAANDAILLVHRYRRLRRQRPRGPAGPLVRLALRERLRPMWTTTITSVVAMLPLLVFPQEGDFWLGLAVTVTGGLLASTLLMPAAAVATISLLRRNRNV